MREFAWVVLGLDNRQNTIESGLRKRSVALADLYLGALQLMEDEQNPGRVYFLAHAAREIINRLPDSFGLTKSRFEVTGRLKTLLPLWEPVRSSLSPTVAPLADTEAPPEVPSEVSVPIHVVRELDRLLRDFEASQQETHRVKASNLLRSLAPDHPIVTRSAVEPVANAYRDLAEWFVSEVHISESAPASFEDCKQKFEVLETFLFSLLSPDFYEPFDELHDIIKQANE
jgi:hypothetical protein